MSEPAPTKWTRTLDSWISEADGRRWHVRRRTQGIALHVDGGFVAGGFSTVEAAKKRARDLAQAEDVEAALAECRRKAADAVTRRWVKAAKAARGPMS